MYEWWVLGGKGCEGEGEGHGRMQPIPSKDKQSTGGGDMCSWGMWELCAGLRKQQ